MEFGGSSIDYFLEVGYSGFREVNMSPLGVFILLGIWTVSQAAIVPSGQCYPSCGLNARCNSDGTCSCPSYLPLGDPGFICYGPTRSGCFAFGDPQVTGFNAEGSRIMFPCKITVAQFDTPMPGSSSASGSSVDESIERFSGGDPKPNSCRVVVQSTTRMSPGGEYYTESMDVKIVVNKNNAESIWVHLEAGNVNYYLNGGSPVVLGPRDCETVEVDSRPIAVCHVESKGIWLVAAPDCSQTDIVFRPWNVERENQKNADYSDPESKYPYSICHVPPPHGSDNWYLEFYHRMGLETRYGSFLYSFLLHPPYETQPDPECQALTTIFNDCPTPRHVKAVNTCSPILIKYSLCAKGNKENPLVAFKNCMKGFCSSLEKHLCDSAHASVSGDSCPDTPAFDCS
ncbi:hypothetical protein PoB_005682700 [Plakobranchus ocellatus]|uniref:VWFD domain-containing protein n=1 Tax=Plakobranchus ocellatus TaxID=259542 RepID=A0AAV4CG19_9GAST|nr:hypothetical protein PoB_005682700 [Plakobranchus ocellatus]